MECYPACSVCTGLCKVPVPPVPSAAPRRRGSTVSQRSARGSSIPPEVLANRSYYTHLTCDHYTTPDDQRTFRSIQSLLPPRPKGLFYFCEQCDLWKDKKREAKSLELPESPEGIF